MGLPIRQIVFRINRIQRINVKLWNQHTILFNDNLAPQQVGVKNKK